MTTNRNPGLRLQPLSSENMAIGTIKPPRHRTGTVKPLAGTRSDVGQTTGTNGIGCATSGTNDVGGATTTGTNGREESFTYHSHVYSIVLASESSFSLFSLVS